LSVIWWTKERIYTGQIKQWKRNIHRTGIELNLYWSGPILYFRKWKSIYQGNSGFASCTRDGASEIWIDMANVGYWHIGYCNWESARS
jgi:hypothetical protein